MSSPLNLLMPYFSKPCEGITIEINEHLHLFLLRNYQIECNEKNRSFLNELKHYIEREFRIDEEGSGSYFFKTGNTYIQLHINIKEIIQIHPYIVYNETNIKEDLQHIIELDQLLYNVLKTQELQP